MCEQAAEAHKSKGAGHSSRRSRMSSDSGQISKSSVDAILSNSSSTLSTQVSSCLLPWLIFMFLLFRLTFFLCQLDNIVIHFSVHFLVDMSNTNILSYYMQRSCLERKQWSFYYALMKSRKAFYFLMQWTIS